MTHIFSQEQNKQGTMHKFVKLNFIKIVIYMPYMININIAFKLKIKIDAKHTKRIKYLRNNYILV